MRSLAYTRFELLRTLRNARLLVFSLGFPLILYFAIAGPNRNETDFGGSEISLPLPLSASVLRREGRHRLRHGRFDHRAALTRPARGLGVSLPAWRWLQMTGLILVGCCHLPLGILLGHLLTAEVIGPATGGEAKARRSYS